MASSYPNALDNFTDPLSTSPLNSPSHSQLHSDVNDAIEKIEAYVPRRNFLYNGAMQVAQRSSSVASITTSNYYTADRWNLGIVSLGTHTNSVENDAPTGSGFRKSFKVLCTTADASPAGSDELVVDQRLEGQDLQAIRKGTSSAQQLTLSFWVKSNVTGTYIAFLYDADNTRSVSKSYTISSSGTWEFKTLTFPADTTGAFDNDNALSLIVRFYLAAGTNFTSGTLQTTWGSAGTPANWAVGQTNLASATNNYWQVTGVQLNLGAVAAPFEFKSYGQELHECQRYYQRLSFPSTNWLAIGMVYPTNAVYATVPLPVTLRTAPTSITVSGTSYALDAGGVGRGITFAMGSSTTQILGINATSGFNMVNGNAALLAFSTSSNFIELNGTEL